MATITKAHNFGMYQGATIMDDDLDWRADSLGGMPSPPRQSSNNRQSEELARLRDVMMRNGNFDQAESFDRALRNQLDMANQQRRSQQAASSMQPMFAMAYGGGGSGGQGGTGQTFATAIVNMSGPGMNHFGTVREFRGKFKEYSKEEFRKISKTPIVKDILSGMTKLNKEQIKDRIKEHIEAI